MRKAVSSLGAARRWIEFARPPGASRRASTKDKALGRVISWLDGRGRPLDDELVADLGEDYLAEHIGCKFSSMTIGQLLRIQREAPERFESARRIGFVGDIIVGRLCGRRAHDATSLSIGMLYNPRLGRADPEMLKRLSIREDQLPDLLPATTPAGRLREEAARQTRLVAGIPVSPAIHDQYAALIGAGSVRHRNVFFGTGTAWVLVANTARLAPPATRKTLVCPHPVQGLYGQLLSMGNGGSSLQWAMNLLGRHQPSVAQIDDALEAVAPASDGLGFWPLLCTGVGTHPFDHPGGRLSGISLAHSASHLVRAVVEGLACEFARHLAFFTDVRLPIERLVMCGQAAASRATPQIIADVTDRPVDCVAEPAISAFGAATIARSLVDTNSNLAGLAKDLAPTTRTVQPSENVPAYRRLFDKYLEPFNTSVVSQ